MSYMILFPLNGKHNRVVCQYLKRRLAIFDPVELEVSHDGFSALVVQEPPQKTFEGVASTLHLAKTVASTGEQEDFDDRTREAYVGIDTPSFWTSAERNLVTFIALMSIKVDAEYLDIARQAGYAGTPQDQHIPEDNCMFVACQRMGFVESEPAALHEPQAAQRIWQRMMWSLAGPVEEVRAYFGEATAMYYAWMNFFTAWLTAPALVGFVCFLYIVITGTGVDSHPLMPFFELFTVLWATVFTKFWTRQQNTLAWRWGSSRYSGETVIRPEFRGKLRTSPVTGKPERYYSSWLRLRWYALSSVVTAALLCLAFMIMIASLNLQGYVQRPSSPFRIPALARFSAPGRVFDPNSCHPVACLIPTALHVVLIQLLNGQVYRRVAAALTELENHKSEHNHASSLVVKRWLFEAFDCYIALFYLALYEQDVMLVRKELQALYMADCLRRIATEVVLPMLMIRFQERKYARGVALVKKQLQERPHDPNALLDVFKEEYEAFDDYLEMVIEFGYITMFAGAAPGLTLVSLLYNVIELRSDTFKLCFLTRRPTALRASSIGSWHTVLKIQMALAAMTNVYIFGLSSSQMQYWLPWLFQSVTDFDGEVVEVPAVGKGRVVLAVLSAAEHLVALMMVLIWIVVPDEPEELRTAKKRLLYLEEQRFAEDRRRMRQEFVESVKSGRLSSKEVDLLHNTLSAQLPSRPPDATVS